MNLLRSSFVAWMSVGFQRLPKVRGCPVDAQSQLHFGYDQELHRATPVVRSALQEL